MAPDVRRLPRYARGWWWTVVWAVVAAAVLGGGVAWATEGTPRRAALLAQVLAAAALAGTTMAPSLGKPEADVLDHGRYRTPGSRRVAVLHIVITFLYNVALLIALGAAAIRFGILDIPYEAATLRWFPLVTGLVLALVALATGWRVDEEGGVIRSWYTRTHAWVFVAAAFVVVLVAVWLLAAGEVVRGGTALLTERDLLVLSLLAVLGSATQVFLAANLPTTLDLGVAVARLAHTRQRPDASAGTPPVFYAGVIAVGGAALVGFVLYRIDVVRRLGDFENDRVALLLLLVPLALILFFTASVVQMYRESRRGLYTQRMSTQLRRNILVYGTSSVLGTAFGVLLLLNLTGRLPDVAWLHSGRDLSKDLIMATIVAGFGPIGIHAARERRRVSNIEARLPDFLNDLAETRRAGLTLVAALRSSAHADYGALTPEIRKMADQVAWGVPFTDAMRQFAERVPTDLVKRTVYLIIEASESGGSVAQILKAAATDAYELKALEEERRITMTTYLIVIYVVFGVFMTVIAVLDTQFIPEVVAANEAVAATGGQALGTADVDQETMNFVYFNAAVVQAVGNGLVSGVLTEGRVLSGFRHVTYMTVLAWIVFRIFLIG